MYADKQADTAGYVTRAGAISGGNAVGMQQDARIAKRELEVPYAVSRIDSTLSALRVAVDMLDARLTGPVARNVPPAPAGLAGSERRPTATGLGAHLDDVAEQIENTQRRVSDLLERLEV